MSRDETIWHCMGVKRKTLMQAIQTGARTLPDIQTATRACTGHQCRTRNPNGTCCSADILRILAEESRRRGEGPSGGAF